MGLYTEGFRLRYFGLSGKYKKGIKGLLDSPSSGVARFHEVEIRELKLKNITSRSSRYLKHAIKCHPINCTLVPESTYWYMRS